MSDFDDKEFEEILKKLLVETQDMLQIIETKEQDSVDIPTVIRSQEHSDLCRGIYLKSITFLEAVEKYKKAMKNKE